MGKRIGNVKISLTILVCLLLGDLYSIGVSASEGNFVEGEEQIEQVASNSEETLNWSFTINETGHKNVVFTVSNVDEAQNAKLVIKNKDDESEIYVEPFSITNASQKISITISENNYLKSSQTYDVNIEDEKGKATDKKTIQIDKHSGIFDWCYLNSIYAYPNTSIIENVGDSINISDGERVYAEVGFQEYEGKLIDGNLVFSYPEQQIGTIIKYTWKDAYGCSASKEREVGERSCQIPSGITVCRDGVYIRYSSLQNDKRICAVVGDNTYYSAYGIEYSSSWNKCISFPSLIDENKKEIVLYVESLYGSVGNGKDYAIDSGSIRGNITSYPAMASGTIYGDVFSHNLKSISTTIAGVTYEGTVNEKNEFEIIYPKQDIGKTLSFKITDEAGCVDYFQSQIVSKYIGNIDTTPEAYPNHINVMVAGKTKVYVKIGDKIYSQKNDSEECKQLRIEYDKQVAGTTVTVWHESENGCESDTIHTEIKKRTYKIDTYAEVTYMEGLVYIDTDSSSDTQIENAPIVYLMIGGDKYPVMLKEATTYEKLRIWDEDAYEPEDVKIYYYRVEYPKQKIGDTIQIVLEDEDGYTLVKNEKLADLELYVDIDTVDSGSSKIVGWTDPKSSVNITIGKKKYSCKANKNGDFSVKIKPQKVGTKIVVSAKSPDGYTGVLRTKIKKPSARVKFNGNIYVTTKEIKIPVSNGKKGDKVVLKIGEKKYTKKLTSSKKQQTIKFMINNEVKAGSKVTVSIIDHFGTVTNKQSKIVYASATIYVGMSESDINYTPYGKPIEKNDYGWCKQWIFQKGDTYIYAYIQNGIVTDVQKFNY